MREYEYMTHSYYFLKRTSISSLPDAIYSEGRWKWKKYPGENVCSDNFNWIFWLFPRVYRSKYSLNRWWVSDFNAKKTEINFFRSLICSLKTRGSLIGNLLAKILAREALADFGSLPARIHGWVWMWLIRIRRGGEYVTRQKILMVVNGNEEWG